MDTMNGNAERLAPGTEVTVTLVKHPRPAVRFEHGDQFTEHYWRDRWYSVKEVRDAAGQLKGWYCDVARPAQAAGEALIVQDLDLDLWVSPDRSTVLRLDEDEFLASGLAER